MTGSEPSGERCPRCGGELVHGVPINQNAEAGWIGLPYRTAKIFVGTEPLLTDFCRACGTVARLFVAVPDRKWLPR